VTFIGCRSLRSCSLLAHGLRDLRFEPSDHSLTNGGLLNSLSVASDALRALELRGFLSLRSLRLGCPLLRDLTVSECGALEADVLAAALAGAPGAAAGNAERGAPYLERLRVDACRRIKELQLKHGWGTGRARSLHALAASRRRRARECRRLPALPALLPSPTSPRPPTLPRRPAPATVTCAASPSLAPRWRTSASASPRSRSSA
jgi:hypothetical protein